MFPVRKQPVGLTVNNSLLQPIHLTNYNVFDTANTAEYTKTKHLFCPEYRAEIIKTPRRILEVNRSGQRYRQILQYLRCSVLVPSGNARLDSVHVDVT
ncbi:hypothetical protein J6590_028695 [Homalodisca vitripennis]|nr:hypothetical protein J6590_028695 [Homalodisca vitripennis]